MRAISYCKAVTLSVFLSCIGMCAFILGIVLASTKGADKNHAVLSFILAFLLLLPGVYKLYNVYTTYQRKRGYSFTHLPF